MPRSQMTRRPRGEATEISLGEIHLKTAAGDPVRLGELVDRPTILVIPRD